MPDTSYSECIIKNSLHKVNRTAPPHVCDDEHSGGGDDIIIIMPPQWCDDALCGIKKERKKKLYLGSLPAAPYTRSLNICMRNFFVLELDGESFKRCRLCAYKTAAQKVGWPSVYGGRSSRSSTYSKRTHSHLGRYTIRRLGYMVVFFFHLTANRIILFLFYHGMRELGDREPFKNFPIIIRNWWKCPHIPAGGL